MLALPSGLAGCDAKDVPEVGSSSPAQAIDPKSLAELNAAVGLMGRFEFEAAAAAFKALAARSGAPLEAALGEAIAVLNQSREGAQEDALALLGAFRAGDPPRELDLRARYCQGLCLLYLGRAAEAVAAFVPVAEARGADPHVHYFLAQSLEQSGDPTQALVHYEAAAQRDPSLRSAQLGIQRCAQRTGDDGKAERALAAFERLAASPRSRSAEFKYTRMGELGRAAVPESVPRAAWKPSAGPLFEPPTELDVRWEGGTAPAWSSAIDQHAATVDLDGDGRLDLVIGRAIERPTGLGASDAMTLVLLAREDGGFRGVPDHPLSRLAGTRVNSILFGDVDADGRVDAYVCRTGGNRLLLATADGGFRDATAEWNAAGDTRTCPDGALADLDHDGDLDVFILAREGPNELLANTGAGGFRAIGREAGIAIVAPHPDDQRLPRSVIVSDFDFDRDADILVVNETAPNELWLNERLWKWNEGTAPGVSFEQLGESSVAACVIEIADIPLRRLVVATPSYLRFASRVQRIEPTSGLELAAADVTGDGRPNVVLLARERIDVLDEGGRTLVTMPMPEGAQRAQLVTLEPTRGPSVVALRPGASPLVMRPGSGRGAFAALSFAGRDDPSQSMRSNPSGIGTSYAARIGGEWSGGETFRSHTGRGQSLAPVAVGTSPFAALDFVEIEWSDGVLQTETSLEAGKVHRIVEAERQISSCPVVFAWNGARLRFVTDVLGVGGLGYLLEPGVYAEPRPRETLVLPADALVPRADGRLSIALAEPMEETCALDAVRLRAIDLPGGWDVAPDERLGIGGAAPTGELVAWRRAWLPTSPAGAALAEVDLVAPDVGPVDARFLGRLVSEQSLELEFGTAIDAIDEPWLVIDGWVEYPYCQTMFAAWQAGLRYRAPSLEARAADGNWTTLVEEWGYPAGMPRRLALPIPKSKLPAGATALRMRTNMEVRFDSVRLVAREALPAPAVDCRLLAASLAAPGFARRATGPQKQPFYDRTAMRPLWDCRAQRGLATELGDVRALAADADGGRIVFGPGEEVALDFASPPPAASGATRRYVLEAIGWCKDMDLFTKDGETIEPLPARLPEPERATDAGRTLEARTRTRPMGGR